LAVIISFDMDGTLVRKNYVEHVWLEAIPEIYAQKNNMDFREAKEHLESEYMKVGEYAVEWYDIKYWLNKFGLDCNWRKLLEEHANMLRFYPEVKGVLDSLGKKHKLIITSNAAREFIDVESKVLDLERKFEYIFSAVTDFGCTKKSPEVYQRICKILDVERDEIIHVGDNWEFDYLAASKAGIKAFYLDRDRNGIRGGMHVVENLKEFEEKLLDEGKRWMN